MKILSLDSTAQIATVALCEDSRLLAEYSINNGNTHSETILPMIESMLRMFELTTDDIDLFCASAGPGSFTGVRIGAATVKGLAFEKNKPCIGVSSLEALAQNLSVLDGLICPVMNARRKQVYTALFRCHDGKTERLMEDSALAIAELDELLKQYEEPIYLCGDGYEITKANLTSQTKNTPDRLRHQSAYSVAQVAMGLYENGMRTTDTQMVATYLRPCQAERERAERENAKKQAVNYT